MRRLFQYQFNETVDEEHPVGLSMTEVDQALTPRELLIRYSKGQPLGNIHTPIFELSENDEDSFETRPEDDPDFDLADIPATLANIQDRSLRDSTYMDRVEVSGKEENRKTTEVNEDEK